MNSGAGWIMDAPDNLKEGLGSIVVMYHVVIILAVWIVVELWASWRAK